MRTSLTLTGTALLVASVSLVGCKKKPPPPPPPPPVVHAPPPPEPIQVDPLLQQLKPDARVQFPQTQAPVSPALATSVIKLADALAKGDSGKLAALLDSRSKPILNQLTESGGWDEAVKRIEAVRVTFMDPQAKSSEEQRLSQVVLAIQERDGAYVLTWMATPVSDGYVFSAMPSSGEVKPRASDWDGNPANLVLTSASSAIDQALENLPPEQRDAARKAIEEAQNPDPGNDPNAPIRKNTPGGPVTIPRPPAGD